MNQYWSLLSIKAPFIQISLIFVYFFLLEDPFQLSCHISYIHITLVIFPWVPLSCDINLHIWVMNWFENLLHTVDPLRRKMLLLQMSDLREAHPLQVQKPCFRRNGWSLNHPLPHIWLNQALPQIIVWPFRKVVFCVAPFPPWASISLSVQWGVCFPWWYSRMW